MLNLFTQMASGWQLLLCLLLLTPWWLILSHRVWCFYLSGSLNSNIFYASKLQSSDTWRVVCCSSPKASFSQLHSNLHPGYNIRLANEDGVSSRGSAGGRDCCDWDGEPAHHPGTDCYFGAGINRVMKMMLTQFPLLSVRSVPILKCVKMHVIAQSYHLWI